MNPNFPDSADETSFLLTFVKFQSTELVPLHLALAIPDHVIINVGHSVSIICYKNDTTVGLDNLYDMDWLKARKVVIDKGELPHKDVHTLIQDSLMMGVPETALWFRGEEGGDNSCILIQSSHWV